MRLIVASLLASVSMASSALAALPAQAGILESGWCTCQEAVAACDFATDSTSGRKYLVLKTGCTFNAPDKLAGEPSVAYQVTTRGPIPHAQDLRFEVITATAADFADQETHPAPVSAADGWNVSQTPPMNSQGATYGYIIIDNTQTNELDIADIEAVPGQAAAPSMVATLLRATHESDYAIADVPSRAFWTALPLDYASQVPLWLDLEVEPQGLVESIRFEKSAVGNWGAVVTFLPSAPQDATFSLTWDMLLLTRDVNSNERPAIYAAGADPSIWTASTQTAEANDPAIVSTVTGLIQGRTAALDKMLATIGWTSANIKYIFTPPLDASNTFKSRSSTCTGFGNLAAAMGRAAGVPTHVMANIMVGMAQQVHSIDEFYLGAELGWRRVEPQDANSVVPEDYGVMLRIVEPNDENYVGAPAGWAGSGIPFQTFDSPVTDSPEFHFGSFQRTLFRKLAKVAPSPGNSRTLFPDCDDCDNRAEHWADLTGDRSRMIGLFQKARSLWETDMASYIALGSLEPQRQALRSKAPSIQSLDDLDSFLSTLQN